MLQVDTAGSALVPEGSAPDSLPDQRKLLETWGQARQQGRKSLSPSPCVPVKPSPQIVRGRAPILSSLNHRGGECLVPLQRSKPPRRSKDPTQGSESRAYRHP